MTTMQSDTNRFFVTDYVNIPAMEARRQVLEDELSWLTSILTKLNGLAAKPLDTPAEAAAPVQAERRTRTPRTPQPVTQRTLPSNKDLIFNVLPATAEEAISAEDVAKLMRKQGWRSASRRVHGAREVIYQDLLELEKDGFVARRRNKRLCFWHRAV